MATINKFMYWVASLTTPEAAYQQCHLLTGVLVVAIIGHWTKRISLTFFVMIALAAIKEFWFDPTYETPSVAGSDALDFTFYTLGSIVGYVIAEKMP